MTIGASGGDTATNATSQRKILTSVGLTWVFYSDGSDIVYQTSTDGGNTWSSPPKTIGTGDRGYFFTVAQQGDNLYFVYATSENSAVVSTALFTFRSGTMKSDGSISWTGPGQSVPTTGSGATLPTVAVDSSGNPWVAVETAGPNSRHVEVYTTTITTNAGGNWSKVLDIGGLADFPKPILLPLTTGKMALEILEQVANGTSNGREIVVYTSGDGGKTWSSPVTSSATNLLTLSAVSVGDTVYSVTSSTNGGVQFWTFGYGSSSLARSRNIACCTEGYDDASISTNGTSLLFVTYSNSTSILSERSTNLGASWQGLTTVANSEQSIQSGSLSTCYLEGRTIAVAWTSSAGTASSTFDVRFDTVQYSS
jgi:Neuraminidase (sialidase)